MVRGQSDRLHAAAASHLSWAHTEDRTARTAPGRAAFEQKFLDEAGGDPVKAEHLRKAYFLRLTATRLAAKAKRDARARAAEEREADVAEGDVA